MFFSGSKKDDDTIVAVLASALRRDIAFGTLLPDQKLKIAALRERYGGSNHSMRETLRILSTEGLVEATAQRGFRVTSATESDVHDISMVRTEVERIALARALERGDVAWEGRVIAAHHTLRKLEEQVQEAPDDMIALKWDEACRAFSAAYVDACESPRLIDLQRKLFDQSRRFRLAQLREGQLDWTSRKTRQQALVDAILKRSTEAALKLLSTEIAKDLKS